MQHSEGIHQVAAKLSWETRQASAVPGIHGDHYTTREEEDAAPLGDVLLHRIGWQNLQSKPTCENLVLWFISMYRMCISYMHVLIPIQFFIQVKSLKTNPIHYGTVVRFLLYGEHKKDVFATGGEVEVCLVSFFFLASQSFFNLFRPGKRTTMFAKKI